MSVHNTHAAVQSVSYVVGVVSGVTCLDNIMYVVCEESSTIRLYDTQTYSELDVVIDVNGMKDPHDITVCRDSRQLFVADWVGWVSPSCIWPVSVDDHSFVKWLTTDESTTHRFTTITLSVTSQRLLVTSPRPSSLHQYNTTDRQLLHVVQLSQFVKGLEHAVETARETFIIGHTGTAQSEWQDAVSKGCSLSSYYNIL